MMENQHDLLCSNRTIVLRFDANLRWIQRLLGVAILLLVGLLFSGCGGGGGVPPNPLDDEERERPMEEEEEEEEDPPPPPPSCLPQNIPTAAFGPIPCERYNQERNRIAQKHRDRPEFYDPDRSLRDGSLKPLWALSKIKAEYAWADLELKRGEGVEPGEGVTVGVIDTGIDQGHPSFAGKRITEDMREKFLDTAVDETGGRDDTGDFSHGTAVASVIVARPTRDFFPDSDFYGVAPGADLKMFAIPLGTAKPIYEPTTPSNLGSRDTYWSTIFGQVLNQKDIDILNLSFGVPGTIDNYDANDLRNNFGQTIAALEQRGRTEKTILVWAAGNANGKNCEPGTANCVGGKIDAISVEVFPGLVAKIESLRGHSIAVVAVDQSGDIANFSNRCGIAAEWCLAAPGKDIWGAFLGPIRREGIEIPGRGFGLFSGTSFAAPMVAGGVAVMKHFFRDQLSNTELVTRLFATANKKGKDGKDGEDNTYTDRSIYGQGLMDLGAATRPVGTPTVAGGDTVSDGGIGLRLTNLRLGGAFGDALGQSLAGQEIAAFDALGAPFWFRLADLTGSTPVPSSLLRLYELMDDAPISQWIGGQLTTLTPGRVGGSVEQDLGYGRLRFGFLETPTGVEGGHFMLARNATTLTLTGANGMAATAFTTSGLAGRAPTSGAALSWRPFDVPVGFRAGWMNERGTLLGTAAAGAFGSLSADAAFAGIETGFEVGTWRLSADAELGTAIPRLRGGMMTRMSSLTTSAFALHATRLLTNGGSVRVSVSQPLRVEEGRAALSVPIGRTKSGAVLRSSLAADLTPSGRQMNVSAQWRHPLADCGELRFAATWMRHPGHSADAAPGLRLLAGWRFAF